MAQIVGQLDQNYDLKVASPMQNRRDQNVTTDREGNENGEVHNSGDGHLNKYTSEDGDAGKISDGDNQGDRPTTDAVTNGDTNDEEDDNNSPYVNVPFVRRNARTYRLDGPIRRGSFVAREFVLTSSGRRQRHPVERFHLTITQSNRYHIGFAHARFMSVVTVMAIFVLIMQSEPSFCHFSANCIALGCKPPTYPATSASINERRDREAACRSCAPEISPTLVSIDTVLFCIFSIDYLLRLLTAHASNLYDSTVDLKKLLLPDDHAPTVAETVTNYLSPRAIAAGSDGMVNTATSSRTPQVSARGLRRTRSSGEIEVEPNAWASWRARTPPASLNGSTPASGSSAGKSAPRRRRIPGTRSEGDDETTHGSIAMLSTVLQFAADNSNGQEGTEESGNQSDIPDRACNGELDEVKATGGDSAQRLEQFEDGKRRSSSKPPLLRKDTRTSMQIETKRNSILDRRRSSIPDLVPLEWPVTTTSRPSLRNCTWRRCAVDFIVGMTRTYNFACDFYNIIDLLALVPFVAVTLGGGDYNSFVYFNVFRLLRLSRMVYTLRLNRVRQAMSVIFTINDSTSSALAVLFTYMIFVVCVFGTLVFYAERGEWDPATGWYMRPQLGINQEPEQSPYASIPHTFWWVIATISTVGYGEMVPHTQIGRCIGALVMVLGVMFVALPISIMGNVFNQRFEEIRLEQMLQRQMKRRTRLLLQSMVGDTDYIPLHSAFQKWKEQAKLEKIRTTNVEAIVERAFERHRLAIGFAEPPRLEAPDSTTTQKTDGGGSFARRDADDSTMWDRGGEAGGAWSRPPLTNGGRSSAMEASAATKDRGNLRVVAVHEEITHTLAVLLRSVEATRIEVQRMRAEVDELRAATGVSQS